MLNIFGKIKATIQDFATRYPAMLSGVIIYSYLLFSIVHYLIRSRTLIPTFTDILETFDALPFMWLLSVAMVKILDFRARLHESETQRILVQKEIELKQTQLTTLHEVVKSMQHHINNPLAIISLTLGPARRHAKDNADLAKHLDVIEDSTQRIVRTLKTFFESGSYETERIDSVVGTIAALPSNRENPLARPNPHD